MIIKDDYNVQDGRIQFAAIDQNRMSQKFWARDWEHAEQIAEFKGWHGVGILLEEIPA